VPGLDGVPPGGPAAGEHHAPVFQGMVGIGLLLALGVVLFWFARRRGTDPTRHRPVLLAVVVRGPLAIAALELGWVATEVGRQPWTVWQVLRTADAASPNSWLWLSFAVVLLVYAGMTAGAWVVLRSMARRWRAGRGGPAEPLRSRHRPGARGQQSPGSPGREGAAPVSLPVVVAAAMFAGVVVYAVLGRRRLRLRLLGPDGGDARRGGEVRALVDHSIGPVWEANHVWLIYVLVFWWTAFPRAFAAVTTTLYLPLALALLGIVLRGASFAFRKYAATLRLAQAFGAVFATSSVVTPFFLGTVRGDRVRPRAGRRPRRPDRLLGAPDVADGGVLAVGTCSYLAGVFLTADAVRAGEVALGERLRRGSLLVAAATGVVVLRRAGAGLAGRRDARPGLRGRAAPLVCCSAACGAVTLWALVRRATRRRGSRRSARWSPSCSGGASRSTRGCSSTR
jgi:cytochrome d ubiquinol oxidase subunit II